MNKSEIEKALKESLKKMELFLTYPNTNRIQDQNTYLIVERYFGFRYQDDPIPPKTVGTVEIIIVANSTTKPMVVFHPFFEEPDIAKKIFTLARAFQILFDECSVSCSIRGRSSVLD